MKLEKTIRDCINFHQRQLKKEKERKVSPGKQKEFLHHRENIASREGYIAALKWTLK